MLKTLSPGFQVLIFLFIVYFMAGMGDIFYTLSLSFTVDHEILEHANWRDARVILSRNLFFQVFSFLLAFMLIIRFTQEKFHTVIQIRKMALKPVAITFAVFIAGMIGMRLLAWANASVAGLLPPVALEKEMAMDAINERLIFQDDPIQFVFALIVMAALPAICEELVFRGFLIRKMLQSGMGKHASVLLSAAIFSLTHFQPLKFLPIFFLGLCLGYLYQHYKNIKYAMLLHFLINASQIIYGYLAATGLLTFELF